MKLGNLIEQKSQTMNDAELQELSLRLVRLYGRLLHEATGMNSFEGFTTDEVFGSLINKNVIEVSPGLYSFEVDANTDPIAIKYRQRMAN